MAALGGVKQRSAKPLFVGSIPTRASKKTLAVQWIARHLGYFYFPVILPVHGEFQIAFKNWPAVASITLLLPRYSTSHSANSAIRHRHRPFV
jgi:hypothetical protein